MTTTPGRAVRLPRGERRESLLQAAREVFVDSGYHSAAMDDIARRAGVTKPVLYQHFSSKQELYLAVLDEGVEDVLAAVGKGLQSSPDNRSRVAATMDAYLGFMARDDGVYRLVFESDLVNLPAVRDRMESVNAECAQLVSQVIAEDTGLSAEESTLLAFGLIGLAQTAARQWLRNPHTIARPDAGSLLASLAWRGISGFPKNPNPEQ
ncbi:MAG: TetR/AcrR family transcriptional regulator [Actinomycetia bacterium]|nr:TetR/AcrR family transcriptional regulator [Actinomycetes bacterium]MCH9800948.1 TetR/AcrR family transcriptional regulator [Actinomycetes bacterium]